MRPFPGRWPRSSAPAPLGFVQLQPESSPPLGSRPLALACSLPVPASRCEGLGDGEAEGSRCWEAAGTGWDFPAAAPAGAGGKEAASLRSSPAWSLPWSRGVGVKPQIPSSSREWERPWRLGRELGGPGAGVPGAGGGIWLLVVVGSQE